ncbi:hypothetical protein KAU32_00340 [bacterium]|nr:hypothetical protein [bacterium]
MKKRSAWILKYSAVLIVLLFYFFFYNTSSISYLFFVVSKPFIRAASRTCMNTERIFLKRKERSLLETENLGLRELNARLQVKNEELMERLRLFKELSKEIKYIERRDSYYIGTFNIITKYSSFGNTYFVLNGGKKDLIKNGDYITFHGFLLGRVQRAGYSSSIVEWIFNEGVIVDAALFLKENNEEYTLIGLCERRKEGMIFEFLSPMNIKVEDKVSRGMTVLTFGISDTFGSGFVLGRIKKLSQRRINRYSYLIEPAEDIYALKSVSVFRKYSDDIDE